MAPLTRSKTTSSMIPSPTQQQNNPRTYKKTNSTAQSTTMNQIVNDTGESADLPSDTSVVVQSLPDSHTPLLPVNTVAQPPAISSCSTTTGDHFTPQARSRSFHHRTSSFLSSIKKRRRVLFGGGKSNVIRLSPESRLNNLEYMNSRLQLRLALLEPVMGKCSVLEARISELERTIEEMERKITTASLNNVVDVASFSAFNEAVMTLIHVDRALYYPPPNEATTGGMWYTINSTRYWVRSKQELIRLKKRCMRAERRREARRTKRQRTTDRLNQQRREPPAGQQRRQRRVFQESNPDIQSRLRRTPSISDTETRRLLPNQTPADNPQASVTHSQQQHTSPQPQSASHTQLDPSIREATSPSNDEIPLRMHTPTNETWLYISGVANDVTVSGVKEYLSQRLYRSDIECHLLLQKGIDPRSRRSISFKARIPSSCAYIALDSSFWPTGVNVRHFVPAKDF